jgi:protein phosphatase 1 regulatory subunit 10
MLTNYSQATLSPTGYTSSTFFSYPNHAPTLTLNPSLLHNPSHSPVNQSHGQQMNSSIAVAGPSVPSKATLSNVLNGLLSAKGLPSSPMQIVRTIVSMGSVEVDLSMRLQVLSKIRDYAGNDFYQAWASNSEAMEIVRDWLKGAVTSKTGDWDETVMPLLHVR